MDFVSLWLICAKLLYKSVVTIAITWECCCFFSHKTHESIFRELILYQLLCQEHGKWTVALDAHTEITGPFMGCCAGRNQVHSNKPWIKSEILGFPLTQQALLSVNLHLNFWTRGENSKQSDDRFHTNTHPKDIILWRSDSQSCKASNEVAKTLISTLANLWPSVWYMGQRKSELKAESSQI